MRYWGSKTDICPFSLGTNVRNHGDPWKPLYSVIIERNTALPASREETYCTSHDNQKKVKHKIYQGEEFYADNNTLLGEFEMNIPPAPKGQETTTIPFTYDINGILVVDARIDSTGETLQKVIVSSDINMSPEQIRAHMEKLESLKLHPREKEENQLLLARGQRIYQTATKFLREDIGGRLQYYEYLLGRQDEFLLAKWRKTFAMYLDELENMMEIRNVSMKDAADFAAWYEERVTSRQDEDEYGKS